MKSLKIVYHFDSIDGVEPREQWPIKNRPEITDQKTSTVFGKRLAEGSGAVAEVRRCFNCAGFKEICADVFCDRLRE
jgi:hypothetical protein